MTLYTIIYYQHNPKSYIFSANNNQHQRELKELVTLQVSNKWFLTDIGEQREEVQKNSIDVLALTIA